MEILDANLSTYAPFKKFYKGSVICSDEKIALIFTSDELLQELQKSTELFVDGTFNVSSCVMKYNIMFVYIYRKICLNYIICFRLFHVYH